MATRALPDLIARIRVDSSGVDGAMQNLVGSFGRANLALAGLAAGIGILVVGGKSMIDIAQKHQGAELSLAQAVEAHNASIGKQIPIVVDVTKQTAALEAAQTALTRVELGMPAHHKATALQLFNLAQAQEKVTDAQAALTAAEEAGSVQTVSTAINLKQYQVQIDDFIKTNRRYVSDQSEVIDGYAKLTRSGLSQNEVQRAMNDAVDLAAIKHISLSDAVGLLDNAEHGRMRGLIDLGITTAKYTDAQGNLILANHSVAKSMDELDAKLKGGRNTLTDLQQQSNILSNDWQDLSSKGGPVLLILLDHVVKAVTAIYDEFAKIGNDDKLWATISDRLVKMAQGVRAALNSVGIGQSAGQDAADRAAAQLGLPPGTFLPAGSGQPYGFEPNTGYAYAHPGPYVGQTPATSANVGAQTSPFLASGGPGMQSGGSMLPGRIYTVGESEEETVLMHAGGGATVVPSGKGGRSRSGGSDLYVTVNAETNADPHDIATAAAWELRKMRRNF